MGNHVSANKDFGLQMWFQNELSSLAKVSLYMEASGQFQAPAILTQAEQPMAVWAPRAGVDILKNRK
jgi:hypothetical protein